MPQVIIADYPEASVITIDLRPILHPMFRDLKDGISEFSFANVYLFRGTHNYRISRLNENLLVISGTDNEGSFFMLPFGLPKRAVLRELFDRFSFMKNASEKQAKQLTNAGFAAKEDRNNFDYLYLRDEMAALTGRRFHRKKNLVNFFIGEYSCQGNPLSGEEHLSDALGILDGWMKGRKTPGDYTAAKEALERSSQLELCGMIYYVEGKPAAYVLGEELNRETFVVHFEKGIGDYKGLLQFVNQSFAARLPDRYKFINREQDLGDAGLKKSKSSYMPCGFVKKFRVTRPG